MLGDISSVKLRDLEIFDEVSRARSIREAARRIKTTPGQVSKTILHLERLVGVKLLKRSVSGVLMTTQGTELQEIVRDLLANGQRIESLSSSRQKAGLAKTLAVAGTSFLNTNFTAPLICQYANQHSSTLFRFLDLAPDQIVAVGMRGGFEIAVHFGALSWPSTWTVKRLGKSKWKLCARKDHPLPQRPKLEQILEYSFVVPTYWTTEGLVRGSDHFSIPSSKRKIGHETSTADAAIPVMLASDQIAFLPDILVRPYIEAKKLREIRTNEVAVVEKDVFLSVKSDVVPAAVFNGLTELMAKNL